MFYAKNSGFKWLREQLMGKGCHFGRFLVSPRWLTVSELNQSRYVSSLLMGDYYCGVRQFWLQFIWPSRTETRFLSPKSCLNDAVMAIMLHQSNHQCFLMKVCSHRKVEVQYCDKRSLFPRDTARNVMIFTYFNQISTPRR